MKQRPLEEIPPKYYPFLNTYIRRGKRLLTQKKDLEEALRRKKLLLRDKLADILTDISSAHFRFESYGSYYVCGRQNEVHTDYVDLCFDLADATTGRRHKDGWSLELDTNYLDNIFLPITTYVEENATLVKKFDAVFHFELPELIERAKRAIVWTFMDYKIARKRYALYQDLLFRSTTEQKSLYMTIRTMWDDDFGCQVGTIVSYADTGCYAKNRKGEILQVGGYGNKNLLYIKSDKGRKIWRKKWEVCWDNKFSDTELSTRLTSLDHFIPKGWEEKKVDFFS